MGITSPQDETRQVETSLVSYQNIISKVATQLKEIKGKKKLVREELKSLLENDEDYQTKVAQAEPALQEAKERKAQIVQTSEAVVIKVKAAELREEEKELAQALSNHLINYRQITGNNMYESPAGEEIVFVTQARFKPQQLSLF